MRDRVILRLRRRILQIGLFMHDGMMGLLLDRMVLHLLQIILGEIIVVDDLGRQDAGIDQAGGGQQGRAADDIPEFAQVARPWIIQEDLHDLVIESLYRLVELFIGFGQEEIGKQGYVFLSVTEGGQYDGKLVEPMKKILPELPAPVSIL